MKRRLLIAVLALGTFGGFGAGFASMACHHRYRRNAFEQKVTDICTRAVERADHKHRSDRAE